FMILDVLFVFSNEVSVLKVFFFTVGFLTYNILETSVSLVFFVIVVITKFYGVLNTKLKEVLMDINKGNISKSTSQKIQILSSLYNKVYNVQRCSFRLFEFEILMILITTYLNNIVVAFNVYSYAVSPEIMKAEFWFLFIAMIFTFLDLFIIFLACQDNIDTSMIARSLLKGFCGTADVETEKM
ncbi:hypothetical protein ACFFRR_011100, partial [Megaselia abdita]